MVPRQRKGVGVQQSSLDWTVMVTGAGGGIGRATAQRFAEAGATVVCVDRDGDGLDRTVAQVGERALSVVADLTDISRLDALLGQAESEAGPIHGLAQLAAVLRRRSVADVTEEDWDVQSVSMPKRRSSWRVRLLNGHASPAGLRRSSTPRPRVGRRAASTVPSSMRRPRGHW